MSGFIIASSHTFYFFYHQMVSRCTKYLCVKLKVKSPVAW